MYVGNICTLHPGAPHQTTCSAETNGAGLWPADQYRGSNIVRYTNVNAAESNIATTRPATIDNAAEPYIATD